MNLDRIVDIVRRTPRVLDPVTAAASLSWDRQPARASAVSVTVSGGTTGSGSATVAGTSDGAATSEELTWAANGTRRTARLWTALSGLTTSGLANEATVASLSAEAVDEGGSPQPVETTVASGVAAAIEWKGAAGYPAYPGGRTERRDPTVYLSWSAVYTPRPGDLVVEGSTGLRLVVRTVDLLPTPARPRHWEVMCRRYDEEG